MYVWVYGCLLHYVIECMILEWKFDWVVLVYISIKPDVTSQLIKSSPSLTTSLAPNKVKSGLLYINIYDHQLFSNTVFKHITGLPLTANKKSYLCAEIQPVYSIASTSRARIWGECEVIPKLLCSGLIWPRLLGLHLCLK